ncbi:hypothetical protein VMCG_10028 [Cytospora schulzeri]|uniref:Uncharacterized protein n=1 Tax=Cytospora schulzeri TaxID=448051 RepID=A0A423VI03_9PEZI|nr:hypothetical protein VMCG_10028 [Valsa malicola]
MCIQVVQIGQGDVHSAVDLVSEGRLIDGRTKDRAAYERVLRNYHSFLNYVDNRGMTASEAWELIAANEGCERWTMSGVIQYSSDKNVAEQKCRQDQNHGLPDSLGVWDSRESHLSEYRPYLNNVSTAVRRTLAEQMMKDFEGYLGVKFWPELFDGDNEDQLAQFYAQPHSEQVEKSANRLRSLRSRLTHLLSENESQIPMEDQRILRGRTTEVQADNERFIIHTMRFIYELLAFDQGLSENRMSDVATYFDSICLGQWFKHLGNPWLNQTAASYPAEWDNENLHIHQALTILNNVMRENNFDSTGLWSSFAYDKVLLDPTKLDAEGEDVRLAALDRWNDFYKTYMDIVASVMASHTRLKKDRLNAEIVKGWLRASEPIHATGRGEDVPDLSKGYSVSTTLEEFRGYTPDMGGLGILLHI